MFREAKVPFLSIKKHQFAPLSSLSHCEFGPNASYLEQELTCQLYLDVLQRQPGVNTDKDTQEEAQHRNINFPARLDTCAMLILTPARCQHWFLNSLVGGNTNRAVMFLPHSRHGDMSAKSKRLFRRSFRESDGISNGGEVRNERTAPFSPFHSPVRPKAAGDSAGRETPLGLKSK